jgi:hypothetical protein
MHSPLLRWAASETASQHDVYFGEDADAVADADTATTNVYRARQALDVVTYDPGRLEWNKTYYWRVDEVNDADPESPWKGSVWSFTTADFVVVDDFEHYIDDYEAGEAIFEAWIDGLTNDTGSIVGYFEAPFAEQRIVHGGGQSMPMEYNNVGSPYYSEVERAWEQSQDWTVNGVDTLTVYFRGSGGNAPDTLYVAIEDQAAQAAVAAYPDAQALLSTEWLEWKIPLSTLAGPNLATVRKLSIGVGDRGNPTPGGTGWLYIDDIGVTGPESSQ